MDSNSSKFKQRKREQGNKEFRNVLKDKLDQTLCKLQTIFGKGVLGGRKSRKFNSLYLKLRMAQSSSQFNWVWVGLLSNYTHAVSQTV